MVNKILLITCNADVGGHILSVCAGSSYLVHGVEQLGELIETLPVLAGVLLTLHDGFPQLLDVRHPNIVEHRLAFQAILWHCRRGQTKDQHLGQSDGECTAPVSCC